MGNRTLGNMRFGPPKNFLVKACYYIMNYGGVTVLVNTDIWNLPAPKNIKNLRGLSFITKLILKKYFPSPPLLIHHPTRHPHHLMPPTPSPCHHFSPSPYHHFSPPPPAGRLWTDRHTRNCTVTTRTAGRRVIDLQKDAVSVIEIP
jgi:hypothetical protein